MKREYPDHPLVGVGAVVVRNGKVLLVERGNPPGRGLWAIPGGLMEVGETLQGAAEREILEETGLAIRAGDPFHTVNVIVRDDAGAVRFHYVIVDVRAEYLSGEIRTGDDVSEAGWFRWEDLSGIEVSHNTMKLLEKIRGEIDGADPER